MAIHLTIKTATWGSYASMPNPNIIAEQDISLGDALEMVFGRIWDKISLANCASRLERARVRDPESAELALFYELYLGPSGPEYWEKIPDNEVYSYWYSFTRPVRDTNEQWLASGDWSDLMTLHDTLIVYARYFEKSEQMRVSPEVRRHIERLGHKRHFAALIPK